MISQPLLVLTTCANATEAAGLAESLVQQRLAACVNAVDSIKSTYRWQGSIAHGQETLLLIKTTEERYAELERVIRQQSSYELPEVIAIRLAAGFSDYLQWLGAAVAGPGQGTG